METAISSLTMTKAILSDIPVPGLSGAFDALLEVAKIYKQVKANKRHAVVLCNYVQSLDEILKPLIKSGSGKSLSDPLHQRLRKLSGDLAKSATHLEEIRHFKRWDRVLRRDAIASAIAQTNESIRKALELFQVGGAIRQEDLLDRIDRKLDEVHNQGKRVAAGFEASSATTCLKDTRVQLLEELHDWATGGSYEKERFCWLNGPPGAGKSTVAKTIATQLKVERRLAASFFFSRDHESRRNPHVVIPTLAHQLASFNPAFRRSLAESRAEYPDVDDGTMELQLQHLIITPLKDISIETPWVIILDALDECEGQTSASSATEILGLLAQYATKISSHIRFLITSRPEAAMMSAFDLGSLHPLTHTVSLHKIDPRTVADDIQRYVDNELTGEWAKREDWVPVKEDLEGLVARAEGLFIFAATSIKLIKDAPDDYMEPAEMLHRLVHPDRTGVTMTSLDTLYLQILQRAVLRNNGEVAGKYRRVVGALVYLRNPLSAQGLADLLRLPLHEINAVLRPIRSLFMVPMDSKSEIHFYHKSFRDFITARPPATLPRQDPSDYDNLLFYDRSAEDGRLAEDCLLSMDRVLHHNMSGYDDPLCLNADIPDLESRMEVQLPSHARYACLHWAFHLPATPVEGGEGVLRPHLEEWCRRQMLFWLEVLSFCKSLNQAIPCLYAAEKWYKKCDSPEEEVEELLKDGQSFVRTFFGAMQEGASHIYQSGIPFAPDCGLLEKYREFCNNSVKVIEGRSLEWSPLLWTAEGHTGGVACIAFSPDGTRITSGSEDTTVRLWSSDTGNLLSTLDGHTDPVTCIEFSPDSMRIASGSSDGTVCLWSSDMGNLLSTLNSHTDFLSCIAFSPDGTRLASGSHDNTVRLWSSDTGNLLSTLNGHTDWVPCIAFSPDGTRIASGSVDTTVCLWSPDTGNLLFTLNGHTDWVTCTAFSPDGTRIASGSGDKTVCLWSSDMGNLLSTLNGHTDWVTCIAFSPDGTRIASGSHDETARLWSSDTGNLLSTLVGHTDWVTCIAFSPDGTRIASGSRDKTVRIWSTNAGNLLSALNGHTDWVTCIAFSPDGTCIVSGSDDKTVRLWSSDTGNLLSTLNGYTYPVICIAFSPDGTRIASGSDNTTVCLWSPDTGNLLSTLSGHTDSVTSIAFSPDGARIASGSHDKTVRLWSSDTGNLLSTLDGHTDWVTCIAFSPDRTRIASGSHDKTVRLWSSDKGTLLSTLNDHTEWVTCIAFSPDGTRIVSGSHDETVHLWSTNTGNLLSTLNGHTDWVICIAFSPDGTRIASGSEDTTVCLWSSDTGNLLSTLNGHTDSVTCIAFSPDGTCIASGSFHETWCLWSSNTGNLLSILHGHTHGVRCIAFSPDGTRIASGSHDETVRLWSSDTGTLLSTLVGHTAWVTCITFSPDGTHIASGSADETVRLWSSDTGNLLSTLSVHTYSVICIAFSPDGTRIASGSFDTTVRLWSSATGNLLSTLNGHTHLVTHIAFSPDGSRIAGSGSNTICLWSSDTGNLLSTLNGHIEWVRCITFSPGGACIVSGSDDKTVRLWSSDTGNLLSTLNGHTHSVTCTAFSPDGTCIASGSGDKTVRLWSSDTGNLLSTLNGHTYSVTCITFSPDGTRITSGSFDTTVCLWSSDTGHLLSTFNGHTHSVASITFSPDGMHIVTTDVTGHVRQSSFDNHHPALHQGAHSLSNPAGASFGILDINDAGWLVHRAHHLCWIPHANRPLTRTHIVISHGHLFCIGLSPTLILLDVSRVPLHVNFGVYTV